jgi:hypothetical protein
VQGRSYFIALSEVQGREVQGRSYFIALSEVQGRRSAGHVLALLL